MKVDLLPFEGWEKLNDQIRSALQLPADIQPRAYSGMASAIYEIAMSTAQFYSHKRSVAIVEGQTPYFQGLLPYLYKEGYQVQIKPTDQDFKTWMDSLKKDTNFLLSCDDHPITGEVYSNEIDKIANEKKIFHIRLSHNSHIFENSKEVQPYTAKICSFGPNSAVALMGAKFRSPVLVASSMNWNALQFISEIELTQKTAKANEALVTQFEKMFQEPSLAHFKIYFEGSNSRIFDRAVFYSTQVAGEAVQQYLARQIGVEIQEPGFERQIETTHQCRWGGTKSFETWWNPRPSNDVLRGMLILGLDAIQNPKTVETLKNVLSECRISE